MHGGNTLRFHSIIYDPTNKSVYYFLVLLNGSGSQDAVLLYNNIDHVRESVFIGSNWSTINGISVPRSYHVGYAGTVTHD